MKTRILVTAKTYPSLSTSHIETVCTAGIKEDGTWIRLYPIPFRLMDKKQRFQKYQWIEADIERDSRDPRHESHKLCSDIKPLKIIATEDGWKQRKQQVLRNVHTNLAKLIAEARDVNLYTSLAVFKPARILSFIKPRILCLWSDILILFNQSA